MTQDWKHLEPARARALAAGWRDREILVIGDVMLDRYLWGNVSRISPEAPVPVVEVERETVRLGGAANVSQNVLSLGGRPVLLGVVRSSKRWFTVCQIARLCAIQSPLYAFDVL